MLSIPTDGRFRATPPAKAPGCARYSTRHLLADCFVAGLSTASTQTRTIRHLIQHRDRYSPPQPATEQLRLAQFPTYKATANTRCSAATVAAPTAA
jgi:hypothetical protein